MSNLKVPQQKGTYDCGLYATQMLKFLVFGEDFPQWEPEDMEKIRLTMIMELSEMAIRWKR